jgi:hypothetical protein
LIQPRPRTDVRTRLEIIKTAIAEADTIRAAMEKEKYIIEEPSTQNFYKETTKSTGRTVRRQVDGT